MDTLTHSLVGVLVTRSYLPEHLAADPSSRRRLLAYAAIAAAFPDVDYLSMPIDPLSFIADWHRGPTHSLVMLPLWALLIGWLFGRFSGPPQNRPIFILVAAVALASHVLTDLVTAWGSQIFWPLSDYRAALNTTFVIDPYFTGIIVLSLLLCLKTKDAVPARLGLLVLLAYVGLQGWMQQQAEEIAAEYSAQKGLQYSRITALPQPLSPSRWKLVVSHGDSHHIAYLDLLAEYPAQGGADGFFSLLTSYGPPNRLIWQEARRYGMTPGEIEIANHAWHQPGFERFRRFAKIPKLYRTERRDQSDCAWFADVRYVLPGLRTPFRFGMCRHPNKGWYLDRLGRL